MTHPQRFDDADPVLKRVREICLALPGAQEKTSHGHPNFFTKKVFAVYGGVVKGDHYADDHAQAMLFLPDAQERAALVADERFFVPAYYGPAGWLGINLKIGTPDWGEVTELADTSFRNTAPKRLIAELDGRAGHNPEREGR